MNQPPAASATVSAAVSASTMQTQRFLRRARIAVIMAVSMAVIGMTVVVWMRVTHILSRIIAMRGLQCGHAATPPTTAPIEPLAGSSPTARPAICRQARALARCDACGRDRTRLRKTARTVALVFTAPCRPTICRSASRAICAAHLKSRRNGRRWRSGADGKPRAITRALRDDQRRKDIHGADSRSARRSGAVRCRRRAAPRWTRRPERYPDIRVRSIRSTKRWLIDGLAAVARCSNSCRIRARRC